MSFHHDYAKWESRSKKENCKICNHAPMPEGMEDLFELPYSWLDAEPAECIKGACHVVAKFHAVELFDLTDEQLLGIMKEVQLYARALKKVTNAVKINYEIHGNTVPHFHIHLYPRYLDDPFPGMPIDYNKKDPNLYKDGEFAEFVANMRDELKQLQNDLG